MPVDNTIYDRDHRGWWAEDSHLGLLRAMIPARLELLRSLLGQVEWELAGARVLDVGCGGGLFSEALAAEGCAVTGLDPSERSLEAARQHSGEAGLAIHYERGVAERLPFDDHHFDLVCCCDVLEHVDDLDATVRECARVLRPGGALLYDTINRSWASRLFVIWLLQDWPWLRVAPPGLHAWDQFVKPHELDALMSSAGLEPRECTGLAPDMGPVATVKRLADIVRLRRGEIDHARLAQGMVFRLGGPKLLSFAGWALRPS